MCEKSKIHTHDIFAMTSLPNDVLVSGGIDGFLSFTSSDLKKFERYGPFLQQPFVTIAEEGRLMLLKYVNYLEIYKIAGVDELGQNSSISESFTKSNDQNESSDDEAGDERLETVSQPKNNCYKIKDFPEKLLELRSKNDEMVVCCAISNDGHWFAYSTIKTFRLFRFEVQQKSKPKLQLIKNLLPELTPCQNMIFSKNSSALIVVRNNGICTVFELVSDTVEHKESFDISEYHTDLVHQMAMSSCSKFLVMASLCNNISVWNLKRNKWIHSKTLPRYTRPVTSLNLRKNSQVLVVAFSDSKILEYNIDGHFIQFSAMLSEVSPTINKLISCICLDPRKPDSIIFTKNNSINVLVKNTETNPSKKRKSLREQKVQATA